MSRTEDATLGALVRAAPAEVALFTGVPLVVAGVQLLNCYLNGFSPLVAVPFAAVLVAFAVLTTQHQLARFRIRRLHRAPGRTPAD